MKKVKLTGIGALTALALLASCDDGMDFGEQTGTISPSVSCDRTVVSARSAGSRASEITDLTVDDLTLSITSADGKNEQFPATGFPVDRQWPVGKYTMTASYGSDDEEGFGKPAVYGEAQLSVTEGKNTQVELTAKPTKAMVGITFDDSALNYFTDIKATLHSAGGAYIDFNSDETRCAYIKPGTVTVDVTFTKPNGKGGTIEAASFEAKAQYRHNLTLKLGGDGVGAVSKLTISFDETLEQEEINVDISDQILNVPAPVVTLSGATPGETINIIEGTALSQALRFDIKAQGGIRSAVLTTSGESFLKTGWPAEIDLANASEAQQTILENLGFKDLGILRNPGKIAAFDLTEVVKHIPATVETASPVTFALKVTDKNGKVAAQDPLAFSIKVDKQILKLSIADGYTYDGAQTVDILCEYNGGEPLQNTLKLEYRTIDGGYAPLTTFEVEGSRATVYTVRITLPDNARISPSIMIRLASDPTQVIEITAISAPEIALNANDVFSTYAIADVTTSGYNLADKNYEVQISTDGVNFSKVSATLSGSELRLTGLTPGTAYKAARVKVGALISNSVALTTENASQIPGGDMENWTTEEISKSAVFKTYKWTKYIPASPWSTFNDMTLSKCTAKGKRTGAASTESTSDKHSGNSAAMILNVGWGDVATTAGENAGNRTAGELFLGTFSYSGSTATPSYGTNFTSRPSALKFWYKYNCIENSLSEKGIVEISLIDAENKEITKLRQELDASDTYIQKTLELSYNRNAPKAAKISVRFIACNQTGNFSSCGLDLDKQWIGSKLYVDDVELVY